jgi:hypothetical protein
MIRMTLTNLSIAFMAPALLQLQHHSLILTHCVDHPIAERV